VFAVVFGPKILSDSEKNWLFNEQIKNRHFLSSLIFLLLTVSDDIAIQSCFLTLACKTENYFFETDLFLQLSKRVVITLLTPRYC